MQIFSPNDPTRTDQMRAPDDVPLEVLVDLRCEHGGFTRLVPQTNATMQYDKFNRLRLRNGLVAEAPDVAEHLKSQTVSRTAQTHGQLLIPPHEYRTE